MVSRAFVAVAAVLFIMGGASTDAIAQQSSPSMVGSDYDGIIADAKAAMLVDPATALVKAVVAERYAMRFTKGRQRIVAIATARWLQGEAYLRTNDPAKAEAPISNAINAIARLEPKSRLHGDILLSLGSVDGSRGRVGNALIDYQQAFGIYRGLGDTRGQARALVFIAMLYTQAMDQETAEKYYKQALEIYKSDVNLSISIYNNRGLAFAQVRQYPQAKIQFEKALELSKQLDSRGLKEQIYINLARVQLDMKNLYLADRAINHARRVAEPKEPGLQESLTATAAQSALQHGDPAGAKKILTVALANIDPKLTDISYKDIHQTAYDVFSAVGNTKLALVHLQALKRLDDSATKLATSTKTALMAARFDFANQELRISQLKADDLQRSIAFERTRVQTQRVIFFGAALALAVVIGLLAFALFTIRRSRDRVRAANEDLAITNSALGKALAAKTEFLATTSHEIRTPLNGILGMTEVMLADSKLAPDLRDRLDIVHGAGVTMRALVDDILDVAKMETGNLTIESAPFDLCATVTDAARMWEEQARARGLTFDLDLSGCPAMIIGDAARMRQIMFNLLSNALKFTKAGRVSLAIKADEDADNGRMLRVAVSDSGIGIPADKLEEIFESFRQADAGTTRQFGGTGLGLSICRNLARAMGGDVSVTSIVGQGATFTLVLPLIHAEPRKMVDDTKAAADPATLVIDRNPITRSMFKTLLAPHGGPVVFAPSVDDAVVRLAEGGIARVLIDDATLRMGDDPHADLIRIATAAGARAETTLLWPVAAAVESDELLARGVTRVVAKPVSGAGLVAAMFARPPTVPAFVENHINTDLVSHAA